MENYKFVSKNYVKIKNNNSCIKKKNNKVNVSKEICKL